MNDYKVIQKSVEGSLKIEGIKPSDTAKKINKDYLQGNITSVEAVEKIKAYYLGGKQNENR
ncbi:antitoxin VbhA family protein [Candidatus Gracilibacteria bacterium]|jgi:hypothetical protein|nr:antitoxin VbhA family protein [Candidatus Gracilibacteria bacterium]